MTNQKFNPRGRKCSKNLSLMYGCLAWFPGPAMLCVTRARWTTTDSGQNRLLLWFLIHFGILFVQNLQKCLSNASFTSVL